MAMRSIIIALFLALAAFAQEPPAHYYPAIGSDGKYYIPYSSLDSNTQQDSIEAYYINKAERSTQSGLHKKSISTKFLIAGGIGVAASAATLMYIVHTDKEYREEQKERQRNDSTIYEPVDADPLPFLFFIEVGVTVGCLVAGTIFRITGNNRLRKAEYFKKQLEIHHQQKSSVSLEILPIFNPINQAFGGNLLLDF